MIVCAKSCVVELGLLNLANKVYSIPALKKTFENLLIVKIKAVEKEVAHHGWWASRKCFESVWTRLQKISVLSLAFHDSFKRSTLKVPNKRSPHPAYFIIIIYTQFKVRLFKYCSDIIDNFSVNFCIRRLLL